jgi:hypothetical protein
MKVGSLGCGGDGTTREGFGSGASGFAGMTDVETDSRKSGVAGGGLSGVPNFSSRVWAGSSGPDATM